MNCEGYQEQISQLIDNELDDGEAIGLYGHMSTCRDCREFHRSSLQLRSMLLESESILQSEAVVRRKETRRGAPRVQKQPLSFIRGSFSISRVAAAILATLMLVAGGIASTLWLQTSAGPSHENVEYIMTYPPVEVRGFLANQSTHQ